MRSRFAHCNNTNCIAANIKTNKILRIAESLFLKAYYAPAFLSIHFQLPQNKYQKAIKTLEGTNIIQCISIQDLRRFYEAFYFTSISLQTKIPP